MVYFGIRHKETVEFLGFSCHSNGDGEFCNDVAFEFEASYADNIWLVKNEGTAIRAHENDTPWYNASFDSPMHRGIKMKDYEVVKVELST